MKVQRLLRAGLAAAHLLFAAAPQARAYVHRHDHGGVSHSHPELSPQGFTPALETPRRSLDDVLAVSGAVALSDHVHAASPAAAASRAVSGPPAWAVPEASSHAHVVQECNLPAQPAGVVWQASRLLTFVRGLFFALAGHPADRLPSSRGPPSRLL